MVKHDHGMMAFCMGLFIVSTAITQDVRKMADDFRKAMNASKIVDRYFTFPYRTFDGEGRFF